MPGDTRVMQIQDALNAKWEANLAVDGEWGPRTCGQAYDFQLYWNFRDSPLLQADFFTELGLPAEWVYYYETSCTPYYTGGATTPTPSTPSPGPVTPVPSAPSPAVSEPIDWKSWLLPAAGAASGVLIGLAGKEVIAPRKGDPLLFGAMGGLTGLVGGLVARGVLKR